MFQSILRAAETQRPQEWGEGRRDPSGSTLQLPGAGGSLSGWLHITLSFPHARVSSVSTELLCCVDLESWGLLTLPEPLPTLLLCTGSCRGGEQIPTDPEERWHPCILLFSVYPAAEILS